MAELHRNQMYFLMNDYDKERKYINWQKRFDDVSDLAYYGNQSELRSAYAKYSLTANGVLSGSDVATGIHSASDRDFACP